MAMTKAEKAAMEAALTAAALRSTSRVLPDVPPPENGGHRVGWRPRVNFSSYGRLVDAEKAWTEEAVHGGGEYRKGLHRSASRGQIRLYSTRLLALRAARYEAEQRVAELLRGVDRLIEEELAAAAKEQR